MKVYNFITSAHVFSREKNICLNPFFGKFFIILRKRKLRNTYLVILAVHEKMFSVKSK